MLRTKPETGLAYGGGHSTRFRNTVRQVLKNSLALAVMHFPATLAVAAIGAFCIFVTWLVPVVVCIMPSTGVLMMSFMTEKVFRLYMTEKDKRTEDKRNMEWHDDYDASPGQTKKTGGVKKIEGK